MAEPASGEFDRRYAAWAHLHRNEGPARSFSYAWRLPELARREGGLARFRGALALAQTLFAMGRYTDALTALLDSHDAAPPSLIAQALYCRACCLATRDEMEAARSSLEGAAALWPDRLDALAAQAHFAFVCDVPDPVAGAAYLQAAREVGVEAHLARARLLADWAGPDVVEAGECHQALAWLRQHAPAEAAEDEALHAEARFRQSPAQALVWLDHTLEQVDRYGQHRLKTRLLHRKSQALEAAGQLGEAARFLGLARESAQRLGAWRELRAMAP